MRLEVLHGALVLRRVAECGDYCLPDTDDKVVVIDPLQWRLSARLLQFLVSFGAWESTVATATTAKATSVVNKTRSPNCSRIPIRICILTKGRLTDCLLLAG